MGEHFSTAKAMQEAVIRGDLDDVQKAAKWMAEHQKDEGLPARSVSLVNALQGLAKVAAEATQMNVAASAAARMSATCGSCHASFDVKVPLPPRPTPTGAGDRSAHMREHQSAVDYMYYGLVAPSDDAWTQGAEALKKSTLATSHKGGDAEMTKRLTSLEQRVQTLADRARNVVGTSGRAAIYAELISGCGECHGLQGRVIGPGAPK
jgi:cytochrome c553